MDKKIVDFTEKQLREVFIGAGLRSEDIDRAIADYMRHREGELSSLFNLAEVGLVNSLDQEDINEIFKDLIDGKEIIEHILNRYLRYQDYKTAIDKTYQSSKSWDEVITTVVYKDILDAQESFIDYVEEIYQTKVKDGKHLQELTGIKEETLKGLEETVIASKYSKYFRALEGSLIGGGKYKDLLQIKPQDYGLPESWDGSTGRDQYSSILWAICFHFNIDEPKHIRPELRSIAIEVGAPYSVLLDCFNLTNKDFNNGDAGD